MSSEADKNAIAIPANSAPPALLSALFDSISQSFETLDRRKSGGFIVEFKNLEDFYFRIEQIVSQYKLHGMRCNFTISCHEGGVFRFTSLERLRSANLSTLAKEVTSVGVSFDILIIPPNNESSSGDPEPQRFKLNMRIEDPIRSLVEQEDYLFLGLKLKQKEINSAIINIQYSDYSVCRTLLAVSEEWLDGLQTDVVDTLGEDKRKAIAKLSDFIPLLLPIAAILGGIFFEPHNYTNIFTPIRYLLFVLLMSIITLAIGIKADEKVSDILGILTARTRFLLSAGDAKRNDKIMRQRKKSWGRLTLIFIGVLLTAVIGLSVNYISSKLF